MSRKSTIEKLPVSTRKALDEKIKSGLLTILELTDWLRGQGFNVSKSAVGRYVKKLQDEDASQIFGTRNTYQTSNDNISGLLEELKSLRKREDEIINLICGKYEDK